MKKIVLIIFSLIFFTNIFWGQEANISNQNQPTNNSSIWDDYVETSKKSIKTLFGFGFGYAPFVGLTSSENLPKTDKFSLQYKLILYHFPDDFFGLTVNTGYTLYRFTLDKPYANSDDRKSLGYIDFSVGPAIKKGIFVFYIAPYAGIKLNSSFFSNEDVKKIVFGFSSGIGLNINLFSLVITILIDFKMSLSEPAFSASNSKLWSICFGYGMLFGL